MAVKQLNTRIQLRYDTWENWSNVSVEGKGGNLVLSAGEVAIVNVPSPKASTDPVSGDDYRPQFLMKVGDGVNAFKDLPFLSAVAADVYAWAKAATKPSYTYTEVGADEAGAADAAEAAAKAYTDAAIQDLDSSKTAATGKAISGITITDGKITSISEIDIGELDTNTTYRFVADSSDVDGYTYVLQKQEKGQTSWTTVSGSSLDLEAVLTPLFNAKMDKAGGTFTGNVTMQAGTKLTLIDSPVNDTDAANKKYVDDAAGDLNEDIQKVAGDLAQEISDREAADTALDGKITAEAEAREAADTALGERIDDVEDDIETLETALETEASTRATADTNLQAAITAEETRAKAEEAKALHSISGSNAIDVNAKSGFAQTVSLKIDETDPGNVVLTQSADGLKAEVEIPAATVTGVKDGDKVLALSGTELTSTIALTHDSTNRKIKLTGVGGTLISEFSTDDFIKDGMLWGEKAFVATATSQEVSITKDSITQTHTFNGLTVGHQYLAFCFTDGAVTPTYSWDIVDLQDLVDVYTAGDGIDISNNVVSIDIADDSESYLTVDASGLKITGIDAIAGRVSDLEAKPGLDKVGTVTSVGADIGLKITGTASINPTVAIDDSVLFILNGGSADTNLN